MKKCNLNVWKSLLEKHDDKSKISNLELIMENDYELDDEEIEFIKDNINEYN